MKYSIYKIKLLSTLLGTSLVFASGKVIAQSAQDRIDECQSDPRVIAGLVSAEICAGADIFFRAKFDGNGRQCGTCHRAEDNFTISPAFIASLPQDDPLFVAENNPNLATLEHPVFLRSDALIVENVDGADDLEHKFTLRSIPHTLSMATSIAPDFTDGSTIPPLERTGWSGDGAPNSGSLRDFLTGAVIQHATLDLDRIPGQSFTLPTEEELDLALAYQLALGRTNELDITSLSLADDDAQAGIGVFMGAGACHTCHMNAGANFLVTGLNANFNTGVENIRLPEVDLAGIPLDGGFGGQGLTTENFDTDGDGVMDAYGNGTFNTPSLVEAADTGPFFHTNAFTTLEESIAFYNLPEFANSPSGVFATIDLSDDEVNQIGRMLRVINTAFNIDMAIQRISAALTITAQRGRRSDDVQRDLIELAIFELEDAIEVLQEAPEPLHNFAQLAINFAMVSADQSLRRGPIDRRRDMMRNAINAAERAREELGTGMEFELAEGNLMR